jgi:hypothetical protein
MFATLDVEPLDQLLAGDKLALRADPVIVACELFAVERE